MYVCTYTSCMCSTYVLYVCMCVRTCPVCAVHTYCMYVCKCMSCMCNIYVCTVCMYVCTYMSCVYVRTVYGGTSVVRYSTGFKPGIRFWKLLDYQVILCIVIMYGNYPSEYVWIRENVGLLRCGITEVPLYTRKHHLHWYFLYCPHLHTIPVVCLMYVCMYIHVPCTMRTHLCTYVRTYVHMYTVSVPACSLHCAVCTYMYSTYVRMSLLTLSTSLHASICYCAPTVYGMYCIYVRTCTYVYTYCMHLLMFPVVWRSPLLLH